MMVLDEAMNDEEKQYSLVSAKILPCSLMSSVSEEKQPREHMVRARKRPSAENNLILSVRYIKIFLTDMPGSWNRIPAFFYRIGRKMWC